ncbi:Gag-Pol polyprotein [Stylophora pistillata]|uniref:Gag-Pol polyprotein n=1 Tax=Stylophora pistillata TaxID=50429 RepID=A0A2B4RZS7_STYPI|nr:Gag-Pol polyprotein [Stylophora pistillata]
MSKEKTSKTPSVKGNRPGPVKRHATQTDLPAKKRRDVCSSSKEHVDDDDRDPEALMNEIIDEINGSDPSDKDLDTDDPDVDETLAELQKEYESDDTPGAKLQHKQLAKLTDKMFRHRMSDKALKDKLDRQERPENSKNAKPTRVNPGIWRKLRDHNKKSDAQMYKIQQALIKGIIPVLRMTDLSMTGNLSNDQLQIMKKLGLEALSLLSHASYEINEFKKLERPGLQALEKERRSKTEHKTSTTVEMDLESSNDQVSDIHVKSFTTGNISKSIATWRLMTSDSTILEMVTGYRIAFDSEPFQTVVPHIHFPRGEEIIETEISKLLTENVIVDATHCEAEFISTVFTRPKKDGSHTLILNLKRPNEQVTYKHFKMESLQTAAQLIKQGSCMAVLDLKDAYYSVPIVTDHRKYLRFIFKNNLYEFTCLPTGLSSVPRSFTKLMKPV